MERSKPVIQCIGFDAARLLAITCSPLRAKRLTLQTLHAHEASNSALLLFNATYAHYSSTRLPARTWPKTNRTLSSWATSVIHANVLKMLMPISPTDERVAHANH